MEDGESAIITEGEGTRRAQIISRQEINQAGEREEIICTGSHCVLMQQISFPSLLHKDINMSSCMCVGVMF